MFHPVSDGLVELLIDKGAEVNAKTDKGETPLHLTVASWFTLGRRVKLLIGKGADVHATTEAGETPLDYALRKRRTSIAEILEAAVAKESDEDKGG